jgi:hypothetical protein
MKNSNDSPETQAPRRRHSQPSFYLPITGRETQWPRRSRQLADALFPPDTLEPVNADDPLGWKLTHCCCCGALVASVILDTGNEHYADLALNENGKLCAIVDLPHPCNAKFAAYALAESDRGAQE